MALNDEKDEHSIAGPIDDHCDCCGQIKRVCLYLLQDGSSAWICEECRDGS